MPIMVMWLGGTLYDRFRLYPLVYMGSIGYVCLLVEPDLVMMNFRVGYRIWWIQLLSKPIDVKLVDPFKRG